MGLGNIIRFGRRGAPTFRATECPPPSLPAIRPDSDTQQLVEYPAALLDLRPGQTLQDAHAHVGEVKPGVTVYDFLGPTRAMSWALSSDYVIQEVRFNGYAIFDDVSVEGVCLRMTLDEARQVHPGLTFAPSRNAIARRGGVPHEGEYYRVTANRFDLDIDFFDNLVRSIAIHPANWMRQQEEIERERLKWLEGEDERQRREEEEPPAPPGSDEALQAWARSMTGYKQTSDHWDWFVKRLQTSGPEAWHDVADYWNWGYGVEPLRWIAGQPKCDRATSLLIFYRADPYYYAETLAAGEDIPSHDREVYNLVSFIRDKWREGFYSNSEFAFDATEYTDPPTPEDSGNPFVRDSMRHSLAGRQLAAGIFFADCPYDQDHYC